MSSKRGTRTYLCGWMDCLLSLTDIHTRGTEKKVFYSCDDYSVLDMRDKLVYRFMFSDNGKPTTRHFTNEDIDGMRANYEDGIFSIVLNDGFCLKLKMYDVNNRKTMKNEFHGFTIGDYFVK